MTDEEIDKLATKLTNNLATKEDILVVRKDIKELNEKTDTILEFVEAVEETTSDHEKRLKVIERVPVVAHQLNSK